MLHYYLGAHYLLAYLIRSSGHNNLTLPYLKNFLPGLPKPNCKLPGV
jgi:hypothetical protein